MPENPRRLICMGGAGREEEEEWREERRGGEGQHFNVSFNGTLSVTCFLQLGSISKGSRVSGSAPCLASKFLAY